MKCLFVSVAALALLPVGLASAQVPESMDPAQVPNYQRLKPGLAVAGKPSPEALQKLKEQGFKTVVDLRMESEGLAEEKAAVEAQGIKYVSIPVSAATLKVEDAQAVSRILADPATGPVLLHCASSNRVGAVLAVIEAQGGASLEDALAAGRKAGMKSDTLVEAVKRVVGAAAEAPPKP